MSIAATHYNDDLVSMVLVDAESSLRRLIIDVAYLLKAHVRRRCFYKYDYALLIRQVVVLSKYV